MILVVGATGILGSEICRLLREKKLSVRAMVRETSDPQKINNLKELGVEIAYGDLRKTSTFKPALQNVEQVITTASSMTFAYVPNENDPILVDRNGMISLVDAAKNAGVKHFVYTSFSGNIRFEFPLSNAKRNVEHHLQGCGMQYTILRPGAFMEAWLTPMVGFDYEHAKVQIFGDGTKPNSYISYTDVARFAIESLENPFAQDKILELGGPEKLAQFEVVKIFEDVMHKPFEVQYIPVEALREQLNSTSDPMQKSFAGLMLSFAQGDSIDMTEMLSNFPVRLRSVEDFVHLINEPIHA